MNGNRTSPDLRWYLDYEMPFPADIYHAFRAELIKEILSNPEGCTLPQNMGWIKIIGNKATVARKLNLDERPKRGFRKKYHPNIHTNGIVFRIRWYSIPVGVTEDVMRKPFFGAEIYNFHANEYFKDQLFKTIQAGDWHKFEVSNLMFHKAPRIKDNEGPNILGSKKVGFLKEQEELMAAKRQEKRDRIKNYHNSSSNSNNS